MGVDRLIPRRSQVSTRGVFQVGTLRIQGQKYLRSSSERPESEMEPPQQRRYLQDMSITRHTSSNQHTPAVWSTTNVLLY